MKIFSALLLGVILGATSFAYSFSSYFDRDKLAQEYIAYKMKSGEETIQVNFLKTLYPTPSELQSFFRRNNYPNDNIFMSYNMYKENYHKENVEFYINKPACACN